MSPSFLLWYFPWGTTSVHSSKVLGFLRVLAVGSVASLDWLAQDGPASFSDNTASLVLSWLFWDQVPKILDLLPPRLLPSPQGLDSLGSQQGFLCPWLSLPSVEASQLELVNSFHRTWTPLCSLKLANVNSFLFGSYFIFIFSK